MRQVYYNLTLQVNGITDTFSFNDQLGKHSTSVFSVRWNTTSVPQSGITELTNTSFRLDFVPASGDVLEVWYLSNQVTPAIELPDSGISGDQITYTQIQDIIWDWVDAYSTDYEGVPSVKYPVIWAEQSGPQPTGRFITLKIISFTPTEITNNYDYKDGEYQYYKNVSITLSINAYGGNAIHILQQIDNSLILPETREYFRSAHLTQYDSSDVEDLTVLLNSNFENRANLDVQFYCTRTITSSVGWIENVNTPTIS